MMALSDNSKRLERVIVSTGKHTSGWFDGILEMASLFYDTLVALFVSVSRRRLSLKRIVDQVLFTGVDAFLLTGFISLLCGVIISIQAMTNMPRIGAGQYFGSIMVIAVIRELGPFFTSIVVIGRSGAALAAYIGNMRVSKEISALEGMGIDITSFIVLPAFLGIIISLVCLSIYFNIIAVVGGLLVARLAVDIPFGIFMAEVIEAVTVTDVAISAGKNIVFGIAIAIISCCHGLRAENIRMVPRTVFRAVVGSIVATLVINAVITIGFYA